MILSRTFVGSIIVAGIGGRKIGHRVVFDVTVLDLIHVLPADLNAAIFGDDRQTALLVLIPYRRRIIERTEAAIRKAETDDA